MSKLRGPKGQENGIIYHMLASKHDIIEIANSSEPTFFQNGKNVVHNKL